MNKGLILIAGVFTALCAVKGVQEWRKRHRTHKAFRRLDRSLDDALEASMDASDAVARY